jgi:acylphosphatase
VTVRFVVFGIVQGVGFRWFVARHARALGFHGHARNLPDGSVEIVVAGQDEALPELERLLREGPANASVERLDRTPQPDGAVAGKSFDVL